MSGGGEGRALVVTTGVVVQEVAEGESCYGVTRATIEGAPLFFLRFCQIWELKTAPKKTEYYEKSKLIPPDTRKKNMWPRHTTRTMQ